MLTLKNLHTRPTGLTQEPNKPVETVSLNDYPMDKVLIHTERRSVYNMVLKMREGTYIIPPDPSTDAEFSTLIEEILMRMPTDVLYSVENMQARKSFFSGVPLLAAIRSLLDNSLVLDLPHRDELHGKRFEDLSAKWQNRIEDCWLTFYVIDAKLPKQVQLDLIKRIAPLVTPPEDPGPFTTFNFDGEFFSKRFEDPSDGGYEENIVPGLCYGGDPGEDQ